MIIPLTEKYRLNSQDDYNWTIEQKTLKTKKTTVTWRTRAYFADIEQALNYILKNPCFYVGRSEKECKAWLKEVQKISKEITDLTKK